MKRACGKFLLPLAALSLAAAPFPVPAEREIVVNVGETLSNVERKPGGFVSSWLLDSDLERPRDPSMVEVYQQLGVESLRFPFGHLSNNYLWTTAPYEQAVDGLTPRVATLEEPPGTFEWAVNPDGTFRQDLDFDEFIAQCAEAGIEPVVVINVMAHKYPGGPTLAELREAAVEWVRYANVAREYGVTYWQLGNEQEHHPDLMTLEEYRDIYGDFSAAMKEVDSTIRTGLAVIKNRQWARTILDAFPDHVDFVGCHQYQWKGWSVQEWVELSEPLVPNALGIEQEIQHSERPDAEMMVTETSSYGDWFDGNGAPDMMRALTFAEMLLHLATIEKVAYTHFWTTHSPWGAENVDGGLSSALTPDNELKPTAEIIGLVNNHLGDHMVGADRVVGALRTFASYRKSQGRLTVFLINKGKRPLRATLRVAGMSPQRVASRLTYTGDDYLDLTPVKTSDLHATLEGETVETILPGISFTILTLE